MRVTPDRLAVARAVQAEYLRHWVEPEHREAAGSLVLESVIEPLPDLEPLPAPTGPGLYWARYAGQRWKPCEVFSDEGTLIVYLPGGDMDYGIGDFDAWIPLVAPTAKRGAE